jgi:hypothetical protein
VDFKHLESLEQSFLFQLSYLKEQNQVMVVVSQQVLLPCANFRFL